MSKGIEAGHAIIRLKRDQVAALNSTGCASFALCQLVGARGVASATAPDVDWSTAAPRAPCGAPVVEARLPPSGVDAVAVAGAHTRASSDARNGTAPTCSGSMGSLIPTSADQNPSAQSRRPMDMIVQGRSMSLFQASQQWSTRPHLGFTSRTYSTRNGSPYTAVTTRLLT